jgi:hypothetical protein
MEKSQKDLKKIFLFGGIAILLTSFVSNYFNQDQRTLAWYPIKRVKAKCATNEYELFLMQHTKVRQSQQFFIDTTNKKERDLSACTFLAIDIYEKWNGIKESRNDIQVQNTIITGKQASRNTISLVNGNQKTSRVQLPPYTLEDEKKKN